MALGEDGNSKNSPSFKPYDASNSLVKKIANRGTGFIGLRSNSYENAEDFNHEDLPNTSMTDDETISPNPKRMKLLHNADPRNYFVKSAIEDGCNIIPPVNDLNVAGPSFKSKCLAASTPAANYYVKNSSLHTGNVSDYLDSSVPSNISSPLPSCSTTQRHNITIPGVHHKDMSSITTYDTNKSLNETSTMMSKRRPSFNAEVFSASNKRLSLSVCESRNRSCLSPFYSARTMYGGASALLPYSSQSGAKLRAASTSNLNVFSAKNQITIQPVPSPHKGGANDQETMSAAARKILDTLERYCSPIKDAKRIPMNESFSKCEDDRTYTPRGVKRKLPSLTQITPSTTDLLRIKRQEKMQDSILNARQAVSNVPQPSISTVADLDSSSDSADLDYTVFHDDTKRKDDVLQSTKRKEESKYDDRPIKSANAPKSGSNAVLNLGNLPRYEITETFTFSKPLTLENFDKAVGDESDNANVKKSSAVGNTNGGGVGKSTQNLYGGDQRSRLGVAATAVSKSPAAARASASGESMSFISTPSSSPLAASQSRIRNLDGGSDTSAAKSTSTNPLLASKPSITSDTSSNKYVSPVGKLGTGRWTCKKCLLDNNSDRCSSCSSSRPEQREYEKNTKSASVSSAGRSEDKSLPSTAAAGSNDKSNLFDGASNTSSFKSNNNKFVVNNVAIGTGFNTFNDLDRNKFGSGDDHVFGATKPVTNIKDNCATAVGADNSKKTDATSDQSRPSDLWKNLQKPAATADDQWKCDVCWIKNKKTDATCAACGEPNKSAPQAAAADQDKTGASFKPKFTFGIPAADAATVAGSTKFGATDTAKPTAGNMLGFGFGNTTAAPATSSNTTAQFTFGSTAAVTNADTKATPSYTFGVKKSDGSTNVFGSPSGAFASDTTTNKVPVDKSGSLASPKSFETGAFNDTATTTNNKKSSNPFAKLESNFSASGTDNFVSGASNSPKINIPQKSTIRENGEDIQPANTTISNDIASSGNMSSPMKKKPLTAGFPLPASMFGGKDNATGASSTANTFASPNGGLLNNTASEFKLPSSASSSATTNNSVAVSQPANLFAPGGFSSSATASSTLSNSKANEAPSFGSATGNSSQSIGMGSPFGGVGTGSSGQPAIFGNAVTMGKKDDKTSLANTADGNKNAAATGASGSLFPMVNNNNNNNTSNITNTVFGSGSGLSAAVPAVANNSIFGHFNSTGGNSTDTNAGKNTMADTAAPTPSLHFNNAAPPANAPFRFSSLTGGIAANAANTTSPQQQQNSNQTNSGGFPFNGPPKFENSMMSSPPKFGQGAFGTPSNTNATTFGSAANTGALTFTFGSSSGTGQADANSAPFSSALKTTSTPDALLKPPATSAFGSAVFGGDAVKKSGGFNFTPANQMTAPAMNSFSSFGSAINDSQDQNRLNNLNATVSTTPFVFSGGAANPPAPAHNYNLTVPATFNFNSGATANSLPQFTATAQPANASTAPVRKIKKAVRRTTK